MKKILLSFIMLLYVIPCAGRTIIIEADGSGDYPTIQAAIDDSNDGDIIELQPGTYTGDGNRDIDFKGLAITVRSTYPNNPDIVASTIIDCNGTNNDQHRAFNFHSLENPNSVLAGLTITNGCASDGGAIRCSESSPTITRCHITGNRAHNGGGLYCKQFTEPIITYCTFSKNYATVGDYGYGGGMYSRSGAPTLVGCLFVENVSNYCGGAISSDRSVTTLLHCTISGNSAATSGGAVHSGDIDITSLTYSILWGNNASTGPEIRVFNHYPSLPHEVIISFSDVQGGPANVSSKNGLFTWGEGNIDADPCFVDTTAGNWHLSPDSPCIDAGELDFLPEQGAVDIDGEPRVMGSRVDIGADEFTSTPATIIGISPDNFEFYANESNPEPEPQLLAIRRGGVGTLNWEVIEDCPWLEVAPASGESSGETDEVIVSVDTAGLVSGSYDCQLVINADGAINGPRIVPITFYFYVAGTYHVPSKYATIQEAIDAAADGDIITVADGVYTGPGNRDIEFNGKAITVKSEHGPENCIIDCNGTEDHPHRGFAFYKTGEHAESVVDGLTITGGYVTWDPINIFPPSYGGAIFCYGSSPTIKNCIIKGNYSESEGGGIYILWDEMSSVAYITNCIVNNNYSGNDGGGIWTDDCTIIANSVISNNFSTGNGGGIWIYSFELNGREIYNCTIIDNSANASGGGMFVGGALYGEELNIVNTIFWGNLAPEGHELSIRNDYTPAGSPPTEASVFYSDIQGNSNSIYVEDGCILNWQQGNIDTDPCFVDPSSGNYHVCANSPCINAGDPNFIPGFREKDVDRDPRVVSGRVDIGADEFAYIGDLDFDGSVNPADLSVFVSQSLNQECNDARGDETDWCYGADINKDGKVDFHDFATLAPNWLLVPAKK